MKVIKIGAVWCPGCLVMKPRWQKIESENPWLKTVYYDFDNDKAEVEKYMRDNILPVFIFIDQNGNEILRLHGEVTEEKLVDLINENRNR